MILVSIRMNVLSEKRMELSQTIASLSGSIRMEKGCRRCDFYQSIEDENRLFLLEEWDTRKNLMAHMESDHFRVLRGARGLLKEPYEMMVHTITTGAKDLAGNALAVEEVWSFTTGEVSGQSSVDLGLAGNFAILSKSGISTTGSTLITGDIGVSPIDSTAITGFGLILDSSNEFATSSLVVGNVYAADYAEPTPTNMTTTVSNMETAYTDAAGRTLPNATELGAGEIGGMTITPGLYKWASGVLITTDVTLNGNPNDIWIFQISGDLTVASGKSVILSGGAQAKNIFWQVAGGTGVEIGTTAHMEGTILSQAAIHARTGASLNGRALAQTAVTLESNTITKPD